MFATNHSTMQPQFEEILSKTGLMTSESLLDKQFVKLVTLIDAAALKAGFDEVKHRPDKVKLTTWIKKLSES